MTMTSEDISVIKLRGILLVTVPPDPDAQATAPIL